MHIVKPKGVQDMVLEGHQSGVTCIVLSSDGQRLVSGGEDRKVKIWEQQDDDSWKLGQVVGEHEGVVYCVALSNDRRRLISASDLEMIVWDLQSHDGKDQWGQHAVLKEVHSEEVLCMALSPDGNLLLSGSDDSTLVLWSLGDAACGPTWERLGRHAQAVCAVVMSRDCKRACSGSMDNTIKVWDVDTKDCIANLTDHGDAVTCLALGVDGHRLVSGSEDRSIRVWDLKTNDCTCVLMGHTDWVQSVALRSDGQELVSCCLDGSIKLWDLDSRLCISTLEGHKEEVWTVALSNDGRWLYSGSDDTTIRVWDLGRGECTMNLEDFNDDGDISLALSKNGRHLVCAPKDEKIMSVWDLMMGERIQVLKGHEGNINAIALNNDGRKLASASADGTVRIWNPQRDICIASLKNVCQGQHETCGVTAVALSGSGHRMAGGCADGTVFVWEAAQVDARPGANAETGEASQWQHFGTVVSHTASVTSLAMSQDGHTLVSGSDDMTIRVWDLKDGKLNNIATEVIGCGVACVALNRPATLIAACFSGRKDKIIEVWELNKDHSITLYVELSQGLIEKVTCVKFAQDGKQLISADGKNVRIWDVDLQQCIATLDGHPSQVSGVAPSLDGLRVVSGSVGGKYDKRVFVWDTETGQCTASLQVNDEPGVTALAMSDTGKHLFSASHDHVIRRWDLEKGSSTELRGHTGPVTAIAMSCKGNLLVSGSDDNSLRLWDVKTGNFIGGGRFGDGEQDDHAVSAVAISSCEQRIACGSTGGAIKLYEISDRTLKMVARVDGHNGAITSMVMCDNGTRLVSGSSDSTINVWDVRQRKQEKKNATGQGTSGGELIVTLEGHDGGVNCVELSSDGRRLVSGSGDTTLKVWDMASGKCTKTLTGHTMAVRCVALSRDCMFLFSGSLDMHIKVWSMGSGTCVATLDGLEDEIRCLALSPNGGRLYSGYPNGKIKAWQLGNGGPGCIVKPGIQGTMADSSQVLGGQVLDADTTSASLKIRERVLSVSVQLKEKLLKVAMSGGDPGSCTTASTTFFLPVPGELKSVELCVVQPEESTTLRPEEGRESRLAHSMRSQRHRPSNDSNPNRDCEVEVCCVFEPKQLGITRKAPFTLKYVSWLADLPRGRVLEALYIDAPPAPGTPCVPQSGTGLAGHVSFLHHLTWLDTVARDKVCRTHNTGFCKAVQTVPGLRAGLRARDLLGRTPLEALLSQPSVRPGDLADLIAAYAYDAAESKKAKDVVELEECLSCLVSCLPHMHSKGLEIAPVWEVISRFGHVTVAEYVPETMAKESLPRLGRMITTFMDDGSQTKWLSEHGKQNYSDDRRYNLMLFPIRGLFSERSPGTLATFPEMKQEDYPDFVLWDLMVQAMPADMFGCPLPRAATDHRTPYVAMSFFLTVHIGQTVCLFLMMLGSEETARRVAVPQLVLGCILLLDKTISASGLVIEAISKIEPLEEPTSDGSWTKSLTQEIERAYLTLASFWDALCSYCSDPYNVIETFIAICPILLILLRVDANDEASDDDTENASGMLSSASSPLPRDQSWTWYWLVIAVALLLSSFKYVSFMRSLPYFAGIVKMMEHIIAKTVPDIVFLLLLSVGFSAANHALLSHFAQDYYQLSYGYTLLRFLMRWVLGDSGIFDIEDNPVMDGVNIEPEEGMFLDKPGTLRHGIPEDMPFAWLPYAIFIIIQLLYVYLVIIVFLNLIIARMGSFYEDVKDRQLSETIESCADTYESSYHRHWDSYAAAFRRLLMPEAEKKKQDCMKSSLLARWCPCDEEPWEPSTSSEPAASGPQHPGSSNQQRSLGDNDKQVSRLLKQLAKMEQIQKEQANSLRKQNLQLIQMSNQHQMVVKTGKMPATHTGEGGRRGQRGQLDPI